MDLQEIRVQLEALLQELRESLALVRRVRADLREALVRRAPLELESLGQLEELAVQERRVLQALQDLQPRQEARE